MDSTHAQRLVRALEDIGRKLNTLHDNNEKRLSEMKKQTAALHEIQEQIKKK